MRWSPRVWFVGLLLCALSARSAALLAAKPTVESGKSTSAPELMRRALQAEAAGQVQQRTELTRQALEAYPAFAPAHWHSGQVLVSDRWLSVAEAAAQAARAGEVESYRQQRRRMHATAADHLKMAHWCAQHQLPGEERLHWLMLLRLAPKSKEAINKLQLVNYRGTLLPRAEVDSLQRRDKHSLEVLREGKARLVRLRHDLEGNNAVKQVEARDALSSVDNPLLIPALESLTAEGSEEIGHCVVASLAKMPAQAATDSLARHAVYAELPEVRREASQALRSRSLYGYVPTMLFAMQQPTEVQFDSFAINGQMLHRLTLFQKGIFADRSYVSAGGTSQDILFSKRYGNSITTRPDVTLNQDLAVAQQQSLVNLQLEQFNERVTAALQTATGQQLPADPYKWASWWYDYNGYYRPETPTLMQTTRNFVPVPYRVRFMSCFVAGTPVWTSTGPMAIERVEVGDCVLAQDVDTGELAFKPVLDTTARPASPLVVISAGKETIRATRGHPFWVSGLGWQMAKELKAGQSLHTPTGPLAIDAVREDPPAPCYNLVVADFGTYFITDSQVLVHDNNLRHVTTAIVPGLAGE